MILQSYLRQLPTKPRLLGKFRPNIPKASKTLRQYSQAYAPVAEEPYLPETSPQPGVDEYWRRIPVWENVAVHDFLSYRWSVSDIILQTGYQLLHAFIDLISRGSTVSFSKLTIVVI